MADKNSSWWDGVVANASKLRGEISGLNGGKGPTAFPTPQFQNIGELMPKNTMPFPMPGVVDDFMKLMPKNPNWNPMAGGVPMQSLGELMPKNPQPFPTIYEGQSFHDMVAATNNGKGPNWGVFKNLINYGNK